MKRIFRREQTYSEAFDEATNPALRVRKLSDVQLLEALACEVPGTVYRIALEAEQRRRDSWVTPAARSVKIATWALAVAILSLVVSLVTAWLDLSALMPSASR